MADTPHDARVGSRSAQSGLGTGSQEASDQSRERASSSEESSALRSADLFAGRIIGLGGGAGTWIALLALAGLWAIGHGYVGLLHDARLYALQIMARIEPALFASDLFLAYGSQDEFTLFTALAAPLVERWGLIPVVRTLAIGGALLWVMAALLLARRWARDSVERRLAVLLLLALPAGYGALEVFEVGRNLATPRVWSEAFVLLALWAWSHRYSDGGSGVNDRESDGDLVRSSMRLTRRWSLLAGVLLVVAVLLHPLMALPGLMIVAIEWWLAVGSWRLARWLVPLGGVAGALVLIWSPGPLGALWQRFDDQWFTIVMQRSPHLAVARWTLAEWSALAFFLGLGVVGVFATTGAGADRMSRAGGPRPRSLLAETVSRASSGWRSRLTLAAIFVACLGVVLNGVGTDLLRNVLLTQLQFFRLTWPLHVIVPIALAGVVVRRCRELGSIAPLVGLWSLAVLALVGISSVQFAFAMILTPLLVWWLAFPTMPRVASADQRLLGRPSPGASRWWLWIVAAGAAVALLVLALLDTSQEAAVYGVLAGSDPTHALYYMAVPLRLSLGLVILAIFLARAGAVSTCVALVFSVVFFLVTVPLFDQRSKVGLAMERGLGASTLRTLVPEGQQMFWQGEVLGAWHLAQRPNYFSMAQGAGVVFERRTAIEYARRRRLLGRLSEALDAPAAELDEHTSTSESRVVAACRDRADLHTVGLRQPMSGGAAITAAITVWPPQVGGAAASTGKSSRPVGGFRVHFYRCADLLAAPRFEAAPSPESLD